MIIVGICGSSGSGKSCLSDYLNKKGFPVADCDAIYRQIIAPPSRCLDAIVDAFGPQCLDPNGNLDRSVLRQKVFSDPLRLKQLNEITFSFITDEVKRRLALCEKDDEKAFFIDAPLLFESGIDAICNYTVAVTAPVEQKLERLLRRDALTKEQILSRLSNQTDDEFLQEKCTHVIENNGNIEDMYQKMDHLLRKWCLPT